MSEIFPVILAACLVNNFVLENLLGVSAVHAVSRTLDTAGGMALGALCAALGLGGWLLQTWEHRARPLGVVLDEQVTLRSGCDLQSRDLLVLHEGAELSVVERGGAWVQVAVPDGPRGWLPSESLGIAELSSRDLAAPDPRSYPTDPSTEGPK